MASLKVMCARSMHVAAGALGEAFARSQGHNIAFDFGTVGALQAKLDAGEIADVVILSAPTMDNLAKAGRLIGDTRRSVARTFIALCVRDGSPRPDIASVEAFRRLLDGAKAIANSDPAVGGSAGVHLARAFEQEGLSALMAAKGMPQKTGAEVAKRVVEGSADFGLTLSGEVASVPGAVIVGPLPGPFGQDTIYSAAVMASSAAKDAAAAFIAALTKSDTAQAWRDAGFEPAY